MTFTSKVAKSKKISSLLWPLNRVGLADHSILKCYLTRGLWQTFSWPLSYLPGRDPSHLWAAVFLRALSWVMYFSNDFIMWSQLPLTCLFPTDPSSEIQTWTAYLASELSTQFQGQTLAVLPTSRDQWVSLTPIPHIWVHPGSLSFLSSHLDLSCVFNPGWSPPCSGSQPCVWAHTRAVLFPSMSFLLAGFPHHGQFRFLFPTFIPVLPKSPAAFEMRSRLLRVT